MYHSRKLPVLIQRPLRLSKGADGRSQDDAAARQGQLYISLPDRPVRQTRLDKKLLTIGHSRRNDIVLSEDGVSNQHARLHQTDEGWQVEDLGSEKGTILNGDKLSPNEPQIWSANQPLQLGEYTLRWAQPMAAVVGTVQSPPIERDEERTSLLDRAWPPFTLGLIAIWLMVLLGVPVLLPFLLASFLTFVGVFITPGFLLADLIGWRLGLDKLEQLALALPMGIVVMALPGMTALLLHMSLTALAIGWFATSAVVVVLWLLARGGVGLFGRLFRESETMPVRPSTPWAIDELLLLGLLALLFLFIFPALSLYKIDGDAYAVNTFAVDALAGLPLNAKEPLFGTDLGTGVRMVFNQYLPVSYLWSYFAGLDPIDLMSLFSRQILALWSVLAMYMLGKSAGNGSRRMGLFTAAIQLLIFAAAPFWRDDNVSIYFFERINADKFFVMVLLVPPCIALAIRYMRNGRRDVWLGAAVVALAASTIHPLSAALLALSLGAFGAFHLLFNLRNREAWKRVAGLAGVAMVVMLLPMVQLVLSRGEAPLAASYPNSFEAWPMGEEQEPILPFINIPALNLYGPLPELDQLNPGVANEEINPFLIWRFAVNMGRQRLIVFNDNLFIAHPRLFLEPPYLLALLLLPILIWRGRKNPAVHFAAGTTLAILFVMFNPLITPLIGELVMPWILWRLIWLLPYALIIALAIQYLLAPKLEVEPETAETEKSRRWLDFTIPEWGQRQQGAYVLSAFVVIVGLVASPAIRNNNERLTYDSSSSYFFPTPERIFRHLTTRIGTGESAMVMADPDLSVTIAAFVAQADILAHRVPTTSEIFPADQQDIALQRLIDQDAFYRTSYLTSESIDILRRYDVAYIIATSGSDLDMQLQLAPHWFIWQLDDKSYSLYAVTSLPSENNMLIKGNDALAERDWATARGLYENTLAQTPGTLMALAGLAEIAQQQGQFDGAQSWLLEGLAQADLPILHARLAQLYTLRANFEQSVAEWEKAVELAPNVARYQVGLGNACLASGLEPCAEEAYVAAASLRSLPDYVARLLVEANLWQQQGRFDRAVPLFEEAVELQPTRFNQYVLESVYREAGQFEQAEMLMETLRSDQPLSPELMWAEANTLTTMNRVDEAAELYGRSILLQTIEVEDTLDTRQALIQLLLDAGQLEEAERELETLMMLAPHNGEAHRLQGDLYRRQGLFNLAAEEYEQAFLLEPTRVTIYATMNGVLRQDHGRPEEWLEILETALVHNPDEPSLYLAMGDYWEQQGNRAEAIDAYLSALEKLDPDTVPGQFLPPSNREGRAFIYSHLARIYENQGQITAALNYYQAMAAVAPDALWTQIVLGDAWMRQDNLGTAETLYLGALEADPDYLIAYLRLAEVQEARGNDEEAQALQAEAMDLAESHLIRPPEEALTRTTLDPGASLPVFSDSESPGATAVTASSDILIQQLQRAEEELETLGLLTQFYVLSGQTDLAIDIYETRLAQVQQLGGSNSLEAQYQKGLGDLYLSKGQVLLAEEAYRQALSHDQWWSEARRGLSNALLAQHDLDGAIQELETAVDFAPGVLDNQLALADALMSKGEQAEARQILETLVVNYPNSARAQEFLAEYYAAFGQPLAAIDLYQQALERNPDNVAIYLALSQLWMAQGNATQAQGILEAGLNVVSDATDLTTALSTLYLEQNKPEEALALLGQGLGRIGENTSLRLAMGNYNASRANYDQAQAWYEQALEQDPDSAAIQIAMADLALHLGEVDRALDHYQQAVELAPTVTGYWLALAGAYQSNGRLNEALDAYEQALTIEPNLPTGYIGQAQILERQEKWEEARATYELALGVMPNSARLMSAYAGYLLDVGNETEALSILEQARADVYDVPTMVAIAALYDDIGQSEVSEELLQSALDLESGSLVVLIGLGDLYEGQGRADEARAVYEQIIALNPGLPLGYLRLGNLANAAGDLETADEYAALAQQVAPGYFGP